MNAPLTQAAVAPRMPKTRYQGSKYRYLSWLRSHLINIEFDQVLDAFGGTASVSYLCKQLGKSVTYNDHLTFNYLVGKALIENPHTHIPPSTIQKLDQPHPNVQYGNVISEVFDGVYFTRSENEWLDIVAQNTAQMECGYVQSMIWYALFQACIAKRPYNLFHRKNLYMRTARVQRSFGNKTTWDQSFPAAFARHAAAANAAIFHNGLPCRAVNLDISDIDPEPFDLVYMDPPYMNRRRVGVDYHAFYHFLEGMTDYKNWRNRIDYRSKHRRLIPQSNPWTSPATIHDAFRSAIRQFADCTIAISYRSDGIPSIEELVAMLSRVKSSVAVHADDRYRYALSTNKSSKEMLLIGT